MASQIHFIFHGISTFDIFMVLQEITCNVCFSGKGMMNKRGFRGSFADAGSSAKVSTALIIWLS